MQVWLPGTYTGQEILDAFKKAASIEVTKKEKWVVEESKGNVEYEPGSLIRVEHIGAKAILHFWSGPWRFLFWGRKEPKWIPWYTEASSPMVIKLRPLRLDHSYRSIDICLGRYLNSAMGYKNGWHENLENDQVLYRPQLERVIASLYKLLVKQES